MPIGGLKEKLLAAKNAGIKTVVVPKKNEPLLSEISKGDYRWHENCNGRRNVTGIKSGISKIKHTL